MKGSEVKEMILSKRVKLWEVAAKLGYDNSYFSKKLRFDFTESEVERIRAAINEILGE